MGGMYVRAEDVVSWMTTKKRGKDISMTQITTGMDTGLWSMQWAPLRSHLPAGHALAMDHRHRSIHIGDVCEKLVQ